MQTNDLIIGLTFLYILDLTLIQTVFKKNTHHIETINLLSLIMKTFLGGANLRTIIGAVEDIHRMITMKMYYLIKKAPISKYFRQRKEFCAEGCTFEYDHLYFFDKTFVYLTDFYGYRSYTSL